MKRSLIGLSLFVVSLVLVGLVSAGEPELPRRMAPPPGMVLARMTPSGDLVLRMLETQVIQVPDTVTGYNDGEKIVNGVPQKKKIPFATSKTKEVLVATFWRKVLIDQSVLYGFFDTKGMPVTRETAAKRLTKETPVVISEIPVESFHLLTAKEDALVLVISVIDLPMVINGTCFNPRTGEPEPVISAPAADDPALPRQITNPPATALAQMSPSGDLSLRLVDAEFKKVPATIHYSSQSEAIVNGKVRKENLTESVSGTRQAPVPVGWRKATLKGEDPLLIFDTKGNPVSRSVAAERLAKESPVLIHFEPVDPLQMSTARDDTLLLVVSMDLFVKMPFGQSFPAIPVAAPLPPGAKIDVSFVPDPIAPFLIAPKETASPVVAPPAAPPLPKPGLVYLETGFAQATDNDAVVVKVVDYYSRHGLQKAKYEPVNEAKPGQSNAMDNFKIDNFITSTPVPRQWRLLALKREEAGFAIHDCKGNAVPWEKARKLLEYETPVLVSPTPIDPLRLSVMKENALVLVIPANLLYPDFFRDMPASSGVWRPRPTPTKVTEGK